MRSNRTQPRCNVSLVTKWVLLSGGQRGPSETWAALSPAPAVGLPGWAAAHAGAVPTPSGASRARPWWQRPWDRPGRGVGAGDACVSPHAHGPAWVVSPPPGSRHRRRASVLPQRHLQDVQLMTQPACPRGKGKAFPTNSFELCHLLGPLYQAFGLASGSRSGGQSNVKSR